MEAVIDSHSIMIEKHSGIRPYTPLDRKEVEDMLITEGVPDIGMCFNLDGFTTFILEEEGRMVGFFTIATLKVEKEYPSLQHFCVRRSMRNATNARKLIRGVRQEVKNMGCKNYIVHPHTEALDKIATHYFKKKPYAVQGIRTYYFVEA
jgi:hypothetical protein